MTYFVSMTDNFMSGWGGARGQKSKYVVNCETLVQAQHIAEVARKQRSEMSYINITTKEPKFYPVRKYQVTRKYFSDLGGVWTDGFDA